MNLRAIVLILSLLSFLSTMSGGYLYYSALKKSATSKIEMQNGWHAESIKHAFDRQILNNLRTVRSLAGHKEIIQALAETNQKALLSANEILDQYNTAFQASVTYLMDRNGRTVASSNRNSPASFVGKNYAFRPYFREAMQKTSSAYMALGVTSGKRGIYISHAVYVHDRTTPMGVVVMKAPVANMEKELLRLRPNTTGMLTLITGPQDVIFMSDHEGYSIKFLEEKPNNVVETIAESRQFGDKPLKWSGFMATSSSRLADNMGNQYIIAKKELASLPGWHVVHLHNVNEVLSGIQTPLLGNLGWIIFSLCFFIGLSVVLLNHKAREDIVKRNRAEKVLQKTRDILQAIFESTADGILVVNDKSEVVFHNKQFQNLWRIPDALVRAKDDEKLLGFVLQQLTEPDAFLSKVQSLYNSDKEDLDKLYFKDGRIFERYSRPLLQAEKIAGRVWSFRDVTEIDRSKKVLERMVLNLQSALDEVRTLRGILPICSHCKSVRDDNGYWSQIEAYIAKHSEAEFSHSICKECAEKYYPDMVVYEE